MALNVTASCAECEQAVILRGPEVTCRVAADGKTGTYEFTCPECGQISFKFMGLDACRLLQRAAGVKWIFPPAELSEINLDAPPLTEDDLLAFAVALYSAPADYIMARAVL